MFRQITKRAQHKLNAVRALSITSPANPKKQGMHYLFSLLKTTGKNDGDYLEFGVYRGRAFLEAYRQALQYRLTGMRFYAFDSFEGLPEVRGEDHAHRKFQVGQYACTQREFQAILMAGNVDLSRVSIIPGFFNDSLTPVCRADLGIRKASAVWIDCDLYESTVPVLDFIAPLITTCTVIAFDDWFSFGGDHRAGQIRATREWLDRNPAIHLEHYRDFGTVGRMFVVQKEE